jgi:hypothetical protein
MASESTPFELRIEFSGVCLFVKDPGRKKVGLLIPDARYRGKDRPLRHADDTPAVPHAGYLRFDLANVVSPGRVPTRDPSETPAYEIVHQFAREELRLVVPPTQENVDTTHLALPDFDEFAPVKELVPGLFEPKPAPELLARTVLYGGTLTSVLETGIQWWMSGELHPQRKAHVHVYGGEVHWRRIVSNGTGVMLRLASLDGNGATEIQLRPTTADGDTPAISLKIANLCATNALEWGTFEPYGVNAADQDFKWLYKLLRLKKGEDPAKYPPSALPHPHPVPTGNMGLYQDCFGGMITAAF